jgi:outer membrane protein assembly factor BamE (lipoprotein component of BamABCDE complex)
MNALPIRIAVLSLLFLASACVVTSSEKTKIEGTKVSENTLAQIEPGSTEEFTIALLGEPTSRVEMSDGTHLLKWTYKKTTTKGGTIIILFAGKKTTEETGTIFVTIKNQRVLKVWRD